MFEIHQPADSSRLLMPIHNTFARIARNAEKLPRNERPAEIAEAVGKAIPFVETAGIRVKELSATRVKAHVINDRAVHNHIGGMHAGATSLLAETVTGLVVAINVNQECVPIIRSMQVDYVGAVEGDLHAEAELSKEDAERIQTSDIGRITISATITDERGNEPIKNSMEWAWLPKRKAMG